jgi:hypothetical protein
LIGALKMEQREKMGSFSKLRARLSALTMSLCVCIGAMSHGFGDPSFATLHLYRTVSISIPKTLVYEARDRDGEVKKSGIVDQPIPNPLLSNEHSTTHLLVAWSSGQEDDLLDLRMFFTDSDDEVDDLRRSVLNDSSELAASFDERTSKCCNRSRRLSFHADLLGGAYPRIDYEFLQTQPEGRAGPAVSRWITVYRSDGILSLRMTYPERNGAMWRPIVDAIVNSLKVN